MPTTDVVSVGSERTQCSSDASALLLAAAIPADRKLLLVVRHGQAISNYLSDTLGPDEWFKVEGTCQYDDKQGTVYNVFDAGAWNAGSASCQ
jgi:hypothetical protein